MEHIFDLLEMEDEQRRELLGMSDRQLEEVARYCNRWGEGVIWQWWWSCC